MRPQVDGKLLTMIECFSCGKVCGESDNFCDQCGNCLPIQDEILEVVKHAVATEWPKVLARLNLDAKEAEVALEIGIGSAFRTISKFVAASRIRPMSVSVLDGATLCSGLIARCWVEQTRK